MYLKINDFLGDKQENSGKLILSTGMKATGSLAMWKSCSDKK